MKVIGITGSIASGKNLITSYMQQLKYQVFDADSVVSSLYSHDRKIISKLSEIFPLALYNNQIDKRKLSDYLMKSSNNWRLLENIVHPIVKQKLYNFLFCCRRRNCQNIAINVPLLFEIQVNKLCDLIIIMQSNYSMINQRLKRRKNYNPILTDIILNKQNNIVKTNKYFVIRTGLSKRQVFDHLLKILSRN